jgi:hypothetical protein
MSPRGRTHRLRPRRGSLYLATLGAAMLVTLLALASVAVVRNLGRRTRLANEVCEARHVGLSGARMLQALLSSRSDWSDWRDLHANGQWYRAPVSDYSFHYCFVDEIDADLADDDTQPVRLYLRSENESSRYALSVVLQPDSPESLLVNGDFETGLVGWNRQWSLTLDVAGGSVDASHCALVTNRFSWYNGIAQNLDVSRIEKGQTYRIQGAIRTVSDASSKMIATLELVADTTSYVQIPSFTATDSWQSFSGQVKLNWSGTLSKARFYVENTIDAGEAPDYMLDNVSMIQSVDTTPLIPQPGTWRRETFAETPPDSQASPLSL